MYLDVYAIMSLVLYFAVSTWVGDGIQEEEQGPRAASVGLACTGSDDDHI